MTSQRLFESREQGKALYAQPRKSAANATPTGDPLLGAKTARNLLLDLPHAQIAFGPLGAQRHAEIDEGRPHWPWVPRKPIQQMAGGRLFGVPARCFLDRSRGRSGLIPISQQELRAAMEAT